MASQLGLSFRGNYKEKLVFISINSLNVFEGYISDEDCTHFWFLRNLCFLKIYSRIRSVSRLNLEFSSKFCSNLFKIFRFFRTDGRTYFRCRLCREYGLVRWHLSITWYSNQRLVFVDRLSPSFHPLWILENNGDKKLQVKFFFWDIPSNGTRI